LYSKHVTKPNQYHKFSALPCSIVDNSHDHTLTPPTKNDLATFTRASLIGMHDCKQLMQVNSSSSNHGGYYLNTSTIVSESVSQRIVSSKTEDPATPFSGVGSGSEIKRGGLLID